ncbi:cell envelope biogenesis protein OmpA [Siphonobacter sp. BAB-5405]|uniref:TonB-dependent receptor n=1 Tax=Siphonobacter sp. BAB-5405 TaxID=1864825 RepID=UPI000C808BC5|nr:TonB-dependent receptor [Siphonobacter sp. BAB-5405]PMD97345.1 cell envelope biogenesis protein OmpA [Siphonobacter sp. BAB-5405]
MMRKFLPLTRALGFLVTLVLLMAGQSAFAQVTTSSISGRVTDVKGETLPGASVVAVHEPSGTRYGTVTNANGLFSLPNVRVGGPYRVTVSFVGYTEQSQTNVFAELGGTATVNVTLSDAGTQLSEVTVRGSGEDVQRVGASTNLSNRQLNTLPTITRSIGDFTRITPQASGNNFGGRDGRYNNIQVDGANLNNNFGLSNDPLPGGGNPISLDAIETVSVNIAPFDVRQSNFTGAGISAITRSGDNEFKGSVYTFYRDQSFNGTKVKDFTIENLPKQQSKIFGARLGGPIIKNKLFFFASYEYEEASRPGINFVPSGSSVTGTPSSVSRDSLARVSNYLREKFNYNTGSYENFPNFVNKNSKILARIDWNINTKHKLTVKYSDFNGTDGQALNGSSVPNGGINRGVNPLLPNGLTRLPNNRFSTRSMSFENSNYGFENTVRSGTAELNSTINSNMSNQIIVTATKTNTVRTFNGGVFPTIDILDGRGQNQISAGMDPFTQNNRVVNDVYSVIDNFTYTLNKHTITAGASYEYQRVGNMFMAPSNGYYIFNSISDLVNDRAPIYYAHTYSLVPGQKEVFSADLKIGLLGIYAQDEFAINPNFTLTAGLRVDKPFYLDQALLNPAANNVQFFAKDGVSKVNYQTDYPNSDWYFSPRVGFKYTTGKNNSWTLRGGTGLFTGRFPLVWLTNIPSNSGMYQFGGSITNPATLANIRLNANPDTYANLFPQQAGTALPNDVVFADKNWKFPQVWRSNLGIDKNLGNGWKVTGEFLYTKDVNAIRMRNANLVAPTGTLAGPDNREVITGSNRLNTNTSSAIVLENTSKGYGYSLTGQISKAYNNGLYGSLAYTYTDAKDVTANPGNRASSVWNANPNVGTSNSLELGYSQYMVPHRIVGTLSYRKEYIKHAATTLTLFFEAASQGNFSYVYNGDINGDGNNTTDLMYIPRDPSEITFVASGTGANAISAEDQSAAFFRFLEQDNYLSKNKGKYAERNAARLPFYYQVDLKLLQDFFINVGKKRHTLQFSADMLNVLNFLNKNWGVRQLYQLNNPLIYRGLDRTTQRPTFNFAQVSGGFPTSNFTPNLTTSSTWSLQLGVRYLF